MPPPGVPFCLVEYGNQTLTDIEMAAAHGKSGNPQS